MEKILKLEHATIKFRERLLLENINFEILKGEQWAITGESGSGKSALLQTLAGKGILRSGKFITYFSEHFKEIHAISDPYFTFHDLISYVDVKNDFKNLSNTSDFYYQQRYNSQGADDAPVVEAYLQKKAEKSLTTEKKWTVDDVIDLFDLRPLLNKHLIKLSNGESKRLRIAAGVVSNPLLLLLDSPYTGLDAGARERFHEIFAGISRSGITVVMTTSPNEIPGMISHVALLSSQRVLKTFKRSDFQPELFNTPAIRRPHLSQLKMLLNSRKKEEAKVIVKMEGVSVKYEDAVILDHIDWEIKPGERWALSGPNGSGKSTLLSLINGDHPQAYANEITLFDRKRGTGESIWEIKSKIGFMSPELFQYFPSDCNCLQVVESGFYETMGLFSHSRDDNRQIAEQWMSLMEIGHLFNFQLNMASASQQRLCLLARAMVKNPPLLILDEPCQGLDRNQQNLFKAIIDEICELSDVTLIYVTHYKEELPPCITKQLVLP